MKFLRLLFCLLLLVPISAADAYFHHGFVGGSTFGLAANRARVPVNVSSITQNTTCRVEHWAHPDGAISSLQTVDVGWWLTGGAPSNSSAYTIKRYIEYPANTFTQITWAAATSGTVSAGGVLKSDIVSIAIPAGAEFWERTVNLNATVANYPVETLPSSATGLGVDDGCVVGVDQGNSGTIAASSTGANIMGAAAIMGTVGVANARSFIIVGDSISFGFGDGGTGAKGGSGWPAQTLDVHGYPYSTLATNSWTANSLASNLTLPQAFYTQLSFTDVIQQLGINDLAASSRTAPQVLADHQTIYGMFSGKKIFQTTITTETTSTDGWATTANQTVTASGTLAAQLNSLNTSIRALPANVFKALDTADAQMSARNSDIWAAPPSWTNDGTHPNNTAVVSWAASLAGSL